MNCLCNLLDDNSNLILILALILLFSACCGN